MSAVCGTCRYFDGEGYLDAHGMSAGECCAMPPVWVGPSPAEVRYDTWTRCLVDLKSWAHPKVGVAAKACMHYEERGNA